MVEGEFVSIALDQDCDICRLVTSEPLVSCDLCLTPLPRNVTMGFNAICEPVHETMRGHQECFIKAHEVLRQSTPFCPSPGTTRRSSSVPGSPRLSLFRTSRSAGSTPSSPRLQQPNILRSRSMPSSPRQPTRSDVMLLNGMTSRSNLASMENLSMSISIQSFSSLEDSVSRVQSPITIRISGVDESENRPSNPTPSRAHALKLETAHSNSAEDLRRAKRDDDGWEPISYSSYFDLAEYTRGQHGLDLTKMEVDSPRPSSRCDSAMFDDVSDYDLPKSPNSDVSDHLSDPMCNETNVSYHDSTADNTPSSCSENITIATDLPSITQDQSDITMSSRSDTKLSDIGSSDINSSDTSDMNKTLQYKNTHQGLEEDYINNQPKLSTNALCDIKVANMQLLTVSPKSENLRKGHSNDYVIIDSSDSSNSDCSSYTVCDMSLSRESALSDYDLRTPHDLCRSVTGHMNNSLHITNSTTDSASNYSKPCSGSSSKLKRSISDYQADLGKCFDTNMCRRQSLDVQSKKYPASDAQNTLLNCRKNAVLSDPKLDGKRCLSPCQHSSVCDCRDNEICQHKMQENQCKCKTMGSECHESDMQRCGGDNTIQLSGMGAVRSEVKRSEGGSRNFGCHGCRGHELDDSPLSASYCHSQHDVSDAMKVNDGLSRSRQQSEGQAYALANTGSHSLRCNSSTDSCLTMTLGKDEAGIINEASASQLDTQLSPDQTQASVDLLSGQLGPIKPPNKPHTRGGITSDASNASQSDGVSSTPTTFASSTMQHNNDSFPLLQTTTNKPSGLTQIASLQSQAGLILSRNVSAPTQATDWLPSHTAEKRRAHNVAPHNTDSQHWSSTSGPTCAQNNRRSLNLDHLSGNQRKEANDKTKNNYRKSWDTSTFNKLTSTILTEPVYSWSPGNKNNGMPQILSEPQYSWSPLSLRRTLKSDDYDSDSDRESIITSAVDIKSAIDEESSMTSSTTSTSSQLSQEGPLVPLRGGDVRRRRQLCNRSMSYTYGSANLMPFTAEDNPTPMDDMENSEALRSGQNTPGSASTGVVVAAIASLRRDRPHPSGRRRPTSMYNMRHPSVTAAFEFDTNQYLRSKFSLARQSWCSCSQDFLFPRRSSKHRLILDNLREGNGNGETFTLTKSPNSSPPQVSPQSDTPKDHTGSILSIESTEDQKDPPETESNIVMITDYADDDLSNQALKYTKEKLQCRSKEDLMTLMEQFYKQIHTVSEELVELLQIRHEAQEQIEMRKIAIEQLLRLQNSDGSVIDATGLLPSSSR